MHTGGGQLTARFAQTPVSHTPAAGAWGMHTLASFADATKTPLAPPDPSQIFAQGMRLLLDFIYIYIYIHARVLMCMKSDSGSFLYVCVCIYITYIIHNVCVCVCVCVCVYY